VIFTFTRPWDTALVRRWWRTWRLGENAHGQGGSKGVSILPTDVVFPQVRQRFNTAIAKVTDIQGEWMGLDWSRNDCHLSSGNWHGQYHCVERTHGVFFEMSNLTGTNEVAQMLADATAELPPLSVG
jgi:hypothetical protein